MLFFDFLSSFSQRRMWPKQDFFCGGALCLVLFRSILWNLSFIGFKVLDTFGGESNDEKD